MMRPLSAAELLDVWERGSAQPVIERAITLLAIACPETDALALAQLSIGQRDALLLTLRELLFGAHASALANCPDCNEQVELSFDIDDVRVADSSGDANGFASLVIDDRSVRFRLPNSLDLMALVDPGDASGARQLLIERCRVSGETSDDTRAAPQFSERMLDELDGQMSMLDPQANIQLTIVCPACHTSWDGALDILAFLWSEVATCAQRLVAEVHTLASTYGWREADILAMTGARRKLYLSVAG